MLNDNKQALETLKGLCLCGICTTGDCANCERYNAKNRAVEALEKQIPKKPIAVYDAYRHDCPECGAYVGALATPFGNWCRKCGQRLDWVN